MREPLDTDQELPVVLGREDAAALLSNLMPPHLADMVWDDIVAPLYDARTMSVRWRHGKCWRCHVEHPASWRKHRGEKPWPGHREYCPQYVGPVEHRPGNGDMGLLGWRRMCSCGESYYEFDEDGNERGACPKAGETWRGPKAGAEL